MATPAHVEVVRKGARAIEAWRHENPRAPFDLAEADLAGADLAESDLADADLRLACLDGADLGSANLAGAALQGASLQGASLTCARLKAADLTLADLVKADLRLAVLAGAGLKGADLRAANLYSAQLCGATLDAAALEKADLKKADLRGAWLYAADLRRADLAEADLCEARLERVLLHGADLAGAVCGGTLFADLDLSAAQGLEAVVHRGPSTIGADTLSRSRGHLPRPFLHGCGVADELTAWAANLAKSPVTVPFLSFFLSHSSKDQEFAEQLAARMRHERLRVWSGADETQGLKDPARFDHALRTFDHWLLVLSAGNLKNTWALNEVAAVRAATGKRTCRLSLVSLVDRETVKKWLRTAAGKSPGADPGEYPVYDFSGWPEPEAFDRAVGRLVKAFTRPDAGDAT